MKKTLIKIGIASLSAIPALAFAQQISNLPPTNNLSQLVNLVIAYINSAVYLIMAVAMIVFVWNIYKYFIAGSDNKDSKKEAGMYVMWSVIGFFIILSFWGLVNILTNTLRLNSRQPNLPFGTYSSQNYSSFGGSVTNYGNGSVTNNIDNPDTNPGFFGSFGAWWSKTF